MARIKHSTLNLGSGHYLMVREMEPYVKLCAESMEPGWDSLSVIHCHSLSPSLPPSQNKKKKNLKKMADKMSKERERE